MVEKRGKIFFIIFVSIFIVFLTGFIFAQNDTSVEGLQAGKCVDECNQFWSSATPSCPGEQKVSGQYPDCKCGWECFEEEANDSDEELYKGYEDAELEVNAGTTPGSTFYFIDKFFDKFGDQIKVKEERVAEIKAMIEAGDLESAKIALEEYMEIAKKLEHEIDPEKREEAKRSAAAIRAVMKDIQNQLPPGERGKFVSDVRSQENKIATAAEIAGKIKELCTQLAQLDPLEYSKMCKIDDDAPEWQKELDEDLTAEQEKIAKEFVSIMKQCFKTSGQECDCDKIPFYDFSVACSKAAPLATACDINDDEAACDELDNLKMPELPDWLEPLWEDLESGMIEAQYDMYMPKECIIAEVKTPKECGKIMIKAHAPLECRAALLEADVDSEAESRRICDKIMMEKHAPECVEKGIINPEKCKIFMESIRNENFESREGPSFGMDCTIIENPLERLDCYDNQDNELGKYYGTGPEFGGEGELTWQCKENRIHWPPDCEKFMSDEWPEQEKKRLEATEQIKMIEEDWRVKEQECATSCDLENGWWDFRDGECVCYATERSYDFESREFDDNFEENSECSDCASKCPDASRTDCVNNKCECYYDGAEYTEVQSESVGDSGDAGETSTSSESSTDGDFGVGDSFESSSSSGEGTEITGQVFLDYMRS